MALEVEELKSDLLFNQSYILDASLLRARVDLYPLLSFDFPSASDLLVSSQFVVYRFVN